MHATPAPQKHTFSSFNVLLKTKTNRKKYRTTNRSIVSMFHVLFVTSNVFWKKKILTIKISLSQYYTSSCFSKHQSFHFNLLQRYSFKKWQCQMIDLCIIWDISHYIVILSELWAFLLCKLWDCQDSCLYLEDKGLTIKPDLYFYYQKINYLPKSET